MFENTWDIGFDGEDRVVTTKESQLILFWWIRAMLLG